jgi:hypothetical protein
MNRKTRAFFRTWLIKGKKVGEKDISPKGKNPQVKYSWKVTMRWISPVVWLLFVLSLIRGILKGALLGLVGVFKTTFYPKPMTHSVTLPVGEKFKWYMKYTVE